MKITKSRLVELITEEAGKMTASEEEVIDEGIFDFLKGEKEETHNQKLNRAFGMLYQKDKHLEGLIAGLSKQLDKISEKLFGDGAGAPEEAAPEAAPEAAARGGTEETALYNTKQLKQSATPGGFTE